jgi:hypothetical protein
MQMGRGVRAAIALLLGVAGPAAGRAVAQVHLELRARASSVSAGRLVDVDLYAAAAENTDFLALDVLLTWDSDLLALEKEVVPSMQFVFGFQFGLLPDDTADGLNNSLTDGDALFQAVSFSPATAGPDGLLIATFQFLALRDVFLTDIEIAPMLGEKSETAVLQQMNVNVTGTLSGTSVEVLSEAYIGAPELTIPQGRIAELPVWGEIEEKLAYGLTLVVELVPTESSVGTVEFTAAADIVQLGDPWEGEPVTGGFTAFDTGETSSPMINGVTADNGSFLPMTLTYTGPLVGFPLIADADALGTWQIKLVCKQCGLETVPSQWDSSPVSLPTGLVHARLHVVAPGDGDRTGRIDVRDAAQFQACYTGDVGPVVPPAYAVAGSRPCAVYDFDDDGDVDAGDWGRFYAEFAGSP